LPDSRCCPPGPRPPLADALSCNDAAVVAERAHTLPTGLLSAIGRVESGRSNIVAGVVLAWPWTINVAGEGRVFADKATAIRAVQALQQAGFRSIDVGCFQINLLHHPAAFTTLDQAFDPHANALYAGRFLRALWARDASWEAAIAAYHSSTPGLADRYRMKVLATWATDGGAVAIGPKTGGPVVSDASLSTANGSARIWSMARVAMGVRVWNAAAPGSRTTK
jgi:hypothetical protein